MYEEQQNGCPATSQEVNVEESLVVLPEEMKGGAVAGEYCLQSGSRSNKIFVVGRFKDQVPLGQAAISQESSVLESGDPSKILRHLSSGDLFTDADGTTANGTAANGTEEPHSLTKQRHISPVGSFDVLDVENLYETGVLSNRPTSTCDPILLQKIKLVSREDSKEDYILVTQHASTQHASTQHASTQHASAQQNWSSLLKIHSSSSGERESNMASISAPSTISKTPVSLASPTSPSVLSSVATLLQSVFTSGRASKSPAIPSEAAILQPVSSESSVPQSACDSISKAHSTGPSVSQKCSMDATTSADSCSTSLAGESDRISREANRPNSIGAGIKIAASDKAQITSITSLATDTKGTESDQSPHLANDHSVTPQSVGTPDDTVERDGNRRATTRLDINSNQNNSPSSRSSGFGVKKASSCGKATEQNNSNNREEDPSGGRCASTRAGCCTLPKASHSFSGIRSVYIKKKNLFDIARALSEPSPNELVSADQLTEITINVRAPRSLQLEPGVHLMESNSSTDLLLTPSEEEICECIKANCNGFVTYTNWKLLLPHLMSNQLLDSDISEYLMSNHTTNHEKGLKFYISVLPSKGSMAYSRFYRSLSDEEEHSGHRTLLELMDNFREK